VGIKVMASINVNMFQDIKTKQKKTCKDGNDMRYVISQPLDYQMFQTPNTQSRFHQPIVSLKVLHINSHVNVENHGKPSKSSKKTNYGDGSLPPISYIHL